MTVEKIKREIYRRIAENKDTIALLKPDTHGFYISNLEEENHTLQEILDFIKKECGE